MNGTIEGLKTLELHTGLACGLRCTFCFRRGNVYEPQRGLLSRDRRREVIDEFAAMNGGQLNVSGGLEPFNGSEATCDAITWGRRAGLAVNVYSNAVAPALSRDDVRRTLAARATWVRFSIHAFHERTYRQIARPVDPEATFHRAAENVRSVLASRPREGGASVGVAFLTLPANARELTEAACFWRDIGVDFFDVRCDMAFGGSACRTVEHALDAFRRKERSGALEPMRTHVRDLTRGRLPYAPECRAPGAKLVVDPFGLVWTCCGLAHPGRRPSWSRLGDLRSETLREVVARVHRRLPLPHCKVCTWWEANYNRKAYLSSRASATTGPGGVPRPPDMHTSPCAPGADLSGSPPG